MRLTFDYETGPIDSAQPIGPEPFLVAWDIDDVETSVTDLRNEAGRQSFRKLLQRADVCVAHNALFELQVSHHLGGGPLKIHTGETLVFDTMLTAYVDDPLAHTHALKPLCADVLNLPPEERDEVSEWLTEYWSLWKHKYPDLKTCPSKTKIMAYVIEAPYELVARYAVGDVKRTCALYHYYQTKKQYWSPGQIKSLRIEHKLVPVLCREVVRGIPLDMEKLPGWVRKGREVLQGLDDRLRQRLHTPRLDFNKPRELAQALTDPDTGQCDRENWPLTEKTGALAASADVYKTQDFREPEVLKLLTWRGGLNFAVQTGASWLKTQLDGRCYPWWRQIGAKTGRMTTANPCFTNITKHWYPPYECGLPSPRTLVVAEPGEVFLKRDMDGQEMRIAAEYERGRLFAAFRENPALDCHDYTRKLAVEAGSTFEGIEDPRHAMKQCNFTAIYVGGIPALQKNLLCSRDQARTFMDLHKQVYPDLYAIRDIVQNTLRMGDSVYTLGGRAYQTSDPDIMRKICNYIGQGSAADQIKRIIVRMAEDGVLATGVSRMIMTVYDEINQSVNPKVQAEVDSHMKYLMSDFSTGVPFTSSGTIASNWGDV